MLSFGSIESAYDKRTVQADKVTAQVTPPVTAKIPLDFFPVDKLSNQRGIGMCTSCASRIGAEESLRDGKEDSDAWGYLMQKFFYDDPTYGRHFEGSSIFVALKVKKNYGSPTKDMESKYPLRLDGTYGQFIEDWRITYGGKIPQEVLDNASKRKIKGYYSVPVDPIAIAREISNGKVLMIRLAVGENTYTPSWSERDLMPLRRPLRLEGGHAMACNEYNGLDESQRLTGPNSWSDRWGRDGYYYFDFDTQKGLFTEAWAIDDIPQEIIEEIKKQSFNKDLYFGVTHPDVKRLQEYLNKNGYVVSVLGQGSKGKETTYFGNSTKKALTEFQLINKIIVSRYEGGAGRLGPRTRQFINSQN